MRKAQDIKAICWHCTAGYSHIPAIEDFWKRPKNKGGAGWRFSKGYVGIVDLAGNKWYLKNGRLDRGYTTNIEECNWLEITNGVSGFNELLINLSYIGGVDPKNVKKAMDSRTPNQKAAMLEMTYEAIMWLKNHGKDVTKDFDIYGHRDFSKDQNNNGVIEPWERIKECPSFSVTEEIGWITNTKKLPDFF